jgi:hypothetical protein
MGGPNPVFALDRFIPVPRRRLVPRRTLGSPRRRRCLTRRHCERMRAVLPAACAIGIAAVAGWMLAGGGVGVGVGENLPFSEILFSRPASVAKDSADGAPVHIDTSPAGAQVRIDGSGAGKTPLDVRLEPGQHVLRLQHPDALDDERIVQIAETGATLDIAMWRKRADVVAIRPVYPGALLLDARFLNDGQVVVLVDLPVPTGAPRPGRELWLLDPSTGRLARPDIAGVDATAANMVLAPSGDQVAYVTPGSSAPVTVTGWSTAGSADKATPRTNQPESVWLASLDGSRPPQRIFQLPSPSPSPVAPATTADPEHIADLVWTPDGSRLVVITRATGAPVRSRLFLLNVSAAADSQAADADELVLLPAEVLPGAAVPEPSGRWLALVTHTAASGGSNLVSLCVLELRAGGAFRDVADLSTGAGVPVTAPVAWPPAAAPDPGDRLVFVGPAPDAAAAGGGLFGIIGALRPSAPPSGLFMADLELKKASGLADAQPRRLGTAINNFGLVWRFDTTLYGFARQDDGTLALHSIDPASRAVHDLGVRLPAVTAQGTTGLSVRWDARHGDALLLAHAPGGGPSAASAGGGPVQAWLVSFVSASAQPGPAH